MQHPRPHGDGGAPPRALVVGVGNADRGDDAVGLRVAEALAEEGPADVTVRTLRGDLTALVDLMHGVGHVVVVDAMRTGGAPGAVRCIDATAGLPADALAGFLSTHAYGLGEALALVEALSRRPARVTIVGIEAASFAHGVALSPPVAAAVTEAVTRVRELLSG